MKEGIISGAVLDVFPQEPLPATSELYDMKNVVMTYHCAYSTPGCWDKSIKVLANELERYSEGDKPRNLIVKERGY